MAKTDRTNVVPKLTKHLLSLAARRDTGAVTSDDAQRILDRWKYRGTRTFIGPVLRKSFKSVGYVRSTVDSNKSRTIRVWKNA